MLLAMVAEGRKPERVEVFYFEGGPNYDRGVHRARLAGGLPVLRLPDLLFGGGKTTGVSPEEWLATALRRYPK